MESQSSGRIVTGDLFDRYLNALGVRARRPSLEALSELTAAHLMHVPFENVSKLYFRFDASTRGLPDLTRFLDGIERYHFGGTCYANNFHLHQLLAHLGYHVTLCGADMAAPNVHMVNIVTLDGLRYLVDAGYAAPFLEPFPLDGAGDREIVWGACRYVLRPRDADGRPRLDMFRDGAPTHGYVVTPTDRRIEEFAGVIAESFTERATFMHALLLARFFPARSITLRNLTLIDAGPGQSRLIQVPRKRLPGVIERQFGIPREVARKALEGVELTRQA